MSKTAAKTTSYGAEEPFFTALYERALNVIFPPRCAGCGLWCGELFCTSCRAELIPIRAPLCALCGQPFDPAAKVLSTSICADCRANRYHGAPPLRAMRAPFRYSGPIREAIHAFKYHGKTARASQLARLLLDYLTSSAEGQAIPLAQLKLIIPVPLHPWRQWRRGYNQSTLLAHELCKQLRRSDAIEVEVAEVLRRVRYTTPQTELAAEDRAANIKDAFALDSDTWKKYSSILDADGAVLLLDDVGTTGATLWECARVLSRAAGVDNSRIYALTLAR
jgi:ComF family protein